MIGILAISGSLREASSNSLLLRAAARLAPIGASIHLYQSIGDLPHFNPDLEGSEPPSVIQYRSLLKTSDAVLISSPEYAHGIPGVLKNALDWVVGSGEFVGKPVALLNASPRSTHAFNSLKEVILTMDARLIEDSCRTIPLSRENHLDETGVLSLPEVSKPLREAIEALVSAIHPV